MLLEVADLDGGYGDKIVVHAIELSVARGQVLGIVGRRGAGKSTLVKCLMGTAQVASGSIFFEDASMLELPTRQRHALGMAYVPQEGGVLSGLTVRSNLVLYRRQRDLADYAELLDCFPRLRERLPDRAGALSSGEKKLVAFCRAMTEGSPLTILDAPCDGALQENAARMAAQIRRRAEQGAAFIIAEQNLEFLLPIATHLLALEHGRTVLVGPASPDARDHACALMQARPQEPR